jgi:hypothetical protein
MAGPITLSLLEYDVLWEHLRLGPFPPVIAVPSPGRTHDERAELRAKVWASLAAKGLGRPDNLDDRLEHRLRRLANPEWELDARIQDDVRTTALATWAGRGATIAVLSGDALTLRGAKPDQVAAETVGLLPAYPAGTGNSITLPAATLDDAARRAGADRDRLFRLLAAQGLGKSEARKITGVIGDVVRLGHFGAARTPPNGTRHRAGHVVSVYDNPAGRYLFTRKKGWVTLVPGTDAAVARQLGELLTELGRT